jgi:hypothetical protein
MLMMDPDPVLVLGLAAADDAVESMLSERCLLRTSVSPPLLADFK